MPEPFDTLGTGLGEGEDRGTDEQRTRKDRATQPMDDGRLR